MVEEYGTPDRRVAHVVMAEKLVARACWGRRMVATGVGARHCLLLCSCEIVDKDVTNDSG